MTDVTQLTDEYLFHQATAPADPPIAISKGKSVVGVIDLQQGSYTSGTVTIDATNQLNGANGFASLEEAYVTVPYVVTLQNGSGVIGTGITHFLGALKANTAAVIDRIQIELNGKSLVTPTNFLSHWNNLRAMTDWSDDDVKIHGASAGLFPDDVCSIGWSGASTSTSGDGYYNNSNFTGAAIAGNSSGVPELPENTGFLKRQLACNPPVVSAGGTAVNPYGWPSTDANAVKTSTIQSGKGCVVIGSGAAGATVATYYYLLKIV